MSEEAWEEMHSEPELGIYGGSTKGKQVSHGIFWFLILIFNFLFLWVLSFLFLVLDLIFNYNFQFLSLVFLYFILNFQLKSHDL